MKTTSNSFVAVLAGIALFSFGGPLQAQYKAVGDDGIAASPRLRERLDEYKRNHSPAPATVETPKMACPKCTNFTFATRDLEPKGLGARTLMAGGTPMKRVTSHNCTGCGTDWKVVGHGKAKQSVATHKCTSCGSEDLACCNTTKGSTVATKGMEKEIKVAPLK